MLTTTYLLRTMRWLSSKPVQRYPRPQHPIPPLLTLARYIVRAPLTLQGWASQGVVAPRPPRAAAGWCPAAQHSTAGQPGCHTSGPAGVALGERGLGWCLSDKGAGRAKKRTYAMAQQTGCRTMLVQHSRLVPLKRPTPVCC